MTKTTAGTTVLEKKNSSLPVLSTLLQFKTLMESTLTEYCFDINGFQSGCCMQRTRLYSDGKAQKFSNTLTSKLRVKLDALQLSNDYNCGHYELTHAPMDTDISIPNSKYYQILTNCSNDLDFIMPQF